MGRGSRGPRTDYDGAWKQALDRYLEPFLRLCFPVVHAGIDWRQKVITRNTELQQIVRSATTGKRHVDKLVEVRRRDGAQEWLLVHLEFQSQPDRHLPERMYEYHRRIVERHQKRVVSVAVLADTSPGFRPVAYEEETWGCRLRFEYPICKLQDFNDALLERENNPAAIVIAAHRAAQRRAQDPVELKAAKWRLIRRLYDRGYRKRDVVEMFRLIDWLIQLPAKLTVEINRKLTEYEDQKRMPYITSIERIGRRQGRQEGRLEGREEGRLLAARDAVRLVLESRFGHVPASIIERLAQLDALDRLEVLLRRASTVASFTEFGRSL
jgi:predicted transposase YdaD